MLDDGHLPDEMFEGLEGEIIYDKPFYADYYDRTGKKIIRQLWWPKNPGFQYTNIEQTEGYMNWDSTEGHTLSITGKLDKLVKEQYDLVTE